MASIVTIYSRTGQPLLDLKCTASWGDSLNDRGIAKITIPKLDPNITADVLKYRNLIKIEHDRAGVWAGVLEHPQSWGDNSIELTAYSPDKLLEFRAATSTTYTGTAGAIFAQIISEANHTQPSGITLGSAASSGGAFSEPAQDGNLYKLMKRVADRSGQEWEFKPVINQLGHLSFEGYWYVSRGSAVNTWLEEGVNLMASTNGPMMVYQSKVVNRWIIRAQQGTKIIEATIEDALSIATYGLCEDIELPTLPDGMNIYDYAARKLAITKQPRRTFKPIAVDVGDTFTSMELGNTVYLRLLNYGFTDGALGLETQVRLIAKEWDETTGQMIITVDEVL